MISWFTKIEWKLVEESEESERKGREREWCGCFLPSFWTLENQNPTKDGKVGILNGLCLAPFESMSMFWEIVEDIGKITISGPLLMWQKFERLWLE